MAPLPTIPELVDKLCAEAVNFLHKKAGEYGNANMLVHQKKLTPGLKEIRELFKKLRMIHKEVTVYDAANMLDNLKKVIEGLKEIREIFMNSRHHNIEEEALIRIVLIRILQEVSEYLRTDYGRVSLPAMKLKAKIDRLNWTVSNLKLQLRLLSISKQSNASSTVSEINEIINIPAVVACLELAVYLPHPLDKNDYQRTRKEVEKVTNDLSYIRSSINNLDNSIYSYKRDILKKFVGRNAREFVMSLLRFSDLINFRITSRRAEEELCYVVREIRLQISSPIKVSRSNWDECDYSQVFDTEHHEDIKQRSKQSSAYGVFKVFYESLELTTKFCLLCFAVIPENEVVKKRFMTHWWVGEGFVTPSVLEARKDIADRIFQELEKKRFIEPVNDNYRPHVVDSYTMNPLTRSLVIMLAKDSRFFYFDEHKGNPTFNFERSYYRACLAKMTFQNDILGLDPEKLRTIFNVNDPYPDRYFKGKRVSKFKNVKVLYLGGWRQSSAENHIEVESVEFLKGLKSMKLLRLFSLQGISMITQLPDSICKLLNLIILDLRACHNLEKLPRGIGSLKMLTHLDVSKCYMLQYMPKGIALLSQLQVLKGFVITDIFHPESCTLYDLVRLDKLRKLNIYTNRKDFPKDTEVTTFTKFKVLQKLAITWGAEAEVVSTEQADGHASQDKVAIFETLEKLLLEGYPSKTAPGLLLPAKLPKLKKLYIRGGKLQNLTNQVEENDKWPTVQVLRLKFLRELKMDWKKIWSSSFPSLIYLEIFKCASFIIDGVFRSAEAMNRKME